MTAGGGVRGGNYREEGDSLGRSGSAVLSALLGTGYRLQDLGLIHYSDGHPHHSSDPAALQRAAQHLDVAGALEQRAERYRIERVMRSWFNLESSHEDLQGASSH